MIITVIDVLLFSAFIAYLLISLFLIFKGFRKNESLLLAAISASSAFWTLGIVLFRTIPPDLDLLFLLNKEFIVASAFIASFFLHFSLVFSKRLGKLNLIQTLLLHLPPFIILFCVNIPDLLIKDILLLDWGRESVLGWGYPYFGLYIVGYFLAGLYFLAKSYLKSAGTYKTQLGYIILATALTGTVDIYFNLILILLGNYRLIWVGPYSSFIWVVVLAYAITKHRLMNISVVISRALAWLLTVLFLGSIYTGFVWLYRVYIGIEIDLAFWTLTILYGILVGQTFQRIRLFLQTTTDRAFIKGWYDYRKVLRKVAASLSKALTREDVVKTIYPILQDDIDVSETKIYFLDDSSKNYVKWDGLTGEPDMQSSIKPDIVQKDISPIDGHIAVPCFSGSDLLGVFVLGKKRSEDEYTDDDLEIFRTIAEYVAIALEYIIKPYEEVKDKFELTERRLVETEKQLERSQRLASLGAVAAGVAHEIRNPLAIIQLKTQNLPDSKELNEYKEAVTSNIERATSIIRQMLKLSKPEVRNISEIDLNQLVQETLQLFVISRVSLKKDLKQVPKIKADQNELKQALINLVDNAVHAMPNGGELAIKTQYDKDTSTVRLEISDTGQGIAPELKEKIFDPFFSTRHEGVGLGLPIAYRIIREHGGTLELKSKVGKGTTFIISFPVSPD